MLIPFVGALSMTLLVSPGAAPTCPDGGNTLFFKSPEGFKGFRLEGDASYRSLFVGDRWQKVVSDPPGPAGRAEFWVGQVLAQWGLTFRETFATAVTRGDRDALEGFYRWEYDFLLTTTRTAGIAVTGVESFNPIEKRGNDGKIRLFKIWKAVIGNEKKGTQFWIATPHPRGVVALTLIVPDGVPVAKAHAVIDTYIANFGSVDDASCKVLREEVRTKR